MKNNFSPLKSFFITAFIALNTNLTLQNQIHRKSYILLAIFSGDTSTRENMSPQSWRGGAKQNRPRLSRPRDQFKPHIRRSRLFTPHSLNVRSGKEFRVWKRVQFQGGGGGSEQVNRGEVKKKTAVYISDYTRSQSQFNFSTRQVLLHVSFHCWFRALIMSHCHLVVLIPILGQDFEILNLRLRKFKSKSLPGFEKSKSNSESKSLPVLGNSRCKFWQILGFEFSVRNLSLNWPKSKIAPENEKNSWHLEQNRSTNSKKTRQIVQNRSQKSKNNRQINQNTSGKRKNN